MHFNNDDWQLNNSRIIKWKCDSMERIGIENKIKCFTEGNAPFEYIKRLIQSCYPAQQHQLSLCRSSWKDKNKKNT